MKWKFSKMVEDQMTSLFRIHWMLEDYQQFKKLEKTLKDYKDQMMQQEVHKMKMIIVERFWMNQKNLN